MITIRRIKLLKVWKKTSRYSERRGMSSHVSFAFECNPYVDPDEQLNLIEKSIGLGCTTIIGTSALDDISRPFELVGDMVAAEQLDPRGFTVGHRLSYDKTYSKSSSGNIKNGDIITSCNSIPDKEELAARWRAELRAVSDGLGWTPAFASIPVLDQPARLLSDLPQTAALSATFAESAKLLATLLAELSPSDGNPRGQAPVGVGIDVSTELLSLAHSPADTRALLGALEACVSAVEASGHDPLLLCATNACTADPAWTVLQWAASRAKPLAVIVTETLRAHERRPGLLVQPLGVAGAEVYSYHSTPILLVFSNTTPAFRSPLDL